MKETYQIRMRCENCNYVWTEKILKGTRSSGSWCCPYCECVTGQSEGLPQEERLKIKITDKDL